MSYKIELESIIKEFFLLNDLEADLYPFLGSYPTKVELTFGFCTLIFIIFDNRDYLLEFLFIFYLLRLDLDEFNELKLEFNNIAFLLVFKPAKLLMLGFDTLSFIIC